MIIVNKYGKIIEIDKLELKKDDYITRIRVDYNPLLLLKKKTFQ